jgi:hypothetical protein
VAQLPFHYYLALREDWIKVHAKPDDDENVEGVMDFNAETLTGESAQ